MTLTPCQQVVLAAIERLSERGYPPSYAEIAKELGLRSLSTVGKHVWNLAQKGYLYAPKHGIRTVTVIPDAQRNGQAWEHCAHDHAPVLHQQEKCPCCVMYQQFVDAAAVT